MLSQVYTWWTINPTTITHDIVLYDLRLICYYTLIQCQCIAIVVAIMRHLWVKPPSPVCDQFVAASLGALAYWLASLPGVMLVFLLFFQGYVLSDHVKLALFRFESALRYIRYVGWSIWEFSTSTTSSPFYLILCDFKYSQKLC